MGQLLYIVQVRLDCKLLEGRCKLYSVLPIVPHTVPGSITAHSRISRHTLGLLTRTGHIDDFPCLDSQWVQTIGSLSVSEAFSQHPRPKEIPNGPFI